MLRRALVLLPALLAIAAGTAAVAAAGPAPAARAPCPRAALPLGVNSVAPATVAALAREKAVSRPQVTAAATAPVDTQRGGQAKAECGTAVWRRTVVVYVVDRALLPSASLSQHVYFVSRFAGGYRVWSQVH